MTCNSPVRFRNGIQYPLVACQASGHSKLTILMLRLWLKTKPNIEIDRNANYCHRNNNEFNKWLAKIHFGAFFRGFYEWRDLLVDKIQWNVSYLKLSKVKLFKMKMHYNNPKYFVCVWLYKSYEITLQPRPKEKSQ